MAATLELRIIRPESLSAPAECDVVLTSESDGSEVRRLIRVDLREVVDVSLPTRDVWAVDAGCDGYWTDSARLGPEDPEATLRLFPAGRLIGTLKVPKGRTAPEVLTMRLSAQAPDDPEPGPSAAWTESPSPDSCSLTDTGHFECLIPSGKRLDGRLEAPGYSSYYFWDLEVTPKGEVDLGALGLVMGSSVVGWVDTSAKPGKQPANAGVKLSPTSLNGWVSDPTAKRQEEIRSYSTRVDRRGFFQLVDLPSGVYRLDASADGMSSAGLDVEIDSAAKEVVLSPIELEPLSRFEAFVTPPTYADGTPWSLSISRKVPGRSQPPPEVEEEAQLDGGFSYEGLPTGTYLVEVEDAYGSTWWQQEVVVEWPGSMVPIVFDLVRVSGRVSFGGDHPASGEIYFGTKSRRPNFRIPTDENGEFQGFVSREGDWPIEVSLDSGERIRTEPVHISTVGGSTTAHVDIELPGTVLEGTVSHRGEPPARAHVVAFATKDSGERELLASRAIAEDGEFEIRGVRTGAVLLRAYTEELSSEWVEVAVDAETRGPRIAIELAGTKNLTGTVVTENGPAAGALVLPTAHLAGRSRPLEMSRTVSAVDGSFQLAVDERATAIELVLIVPGCGIELLRWNLAESASIEPRVASCLAPRGELLLNGGSIADATVSSVGVTVSARKLLSVLVSLGTMQQDERGVLFAGMPPGPYRLCAPSGSCDSGILQPFGALELSLSGPPEPEDTIR